MGEVPAGGDNVHTLAHPEQTAVQPLHLPLTVQQAALLLDSEGGQGVKVVENGHIAVYRGGEDLLIGTNLPEEALHLKEAAAGILSASRIP